MASSTLVFHIAVGSVSLVAGAVAYVYRKGSPGHRLAGKWFAIAMLLMTSSGAYLAYMRPATLSVFVGFLTFYLVATSWLVVKRKPKQYGVLEILGLLFVSATAFGLFYFGNKALASPTGFIEDVRIPAQVYFFFGGTAVLAALGDVHLLLRGGLAGAQRIARHLWRMGFAAFVAVSSLFGGNPQIFPDEIRGTFWLNIPILASIILVAYWLLRVAIGKQFKLKRA